MKKQLLMFGSATLFLATLLPPGAHAVTLYEEAPVTAVDPVYEAYTVSVPVEQCHEAEVAYHEPSRRHSATPTILGAVIGGALGNAVGSGKRNKQVGAVVGAVLGGSIGKDIGRNHRHGERVRYRTEEVCEVTRETREEERFVGYDVSYVYAGTTYKTRMRKDPGEFIRVRVRVTPAE